MKNFEKAKGFTLAETMIVLAVLGVIAVVTVPALVNKHIESANRTKVKKAMSVYDTALNKMVIENGIKDNAALYENANSFAPENDCTNTAPYFKVSTVLNNNPCTFKAPDGLFWDISKINAPILAFKEADLTDETSENRYQLVGHFDNNGSLRVDDLAYESGDNANALTKVYNFINGIKNEQELVSGSSFVSGSSYYSGSSYVSGSNGNDIDYYLARPCQNLNADSYYGTTCPTCTSCSITIKDYAYSGDNYTNIMYDKNNKIDFMQTKCNNEGKTCAENYKPIYNQSGEIDYFLVLDSDGNVRGGTNYINPSWDFNPYYKQGEKYYCNCTLSGCDECSSASSSGYGS